jgi:cytochrome P450
MALMQNGEDLRYARRYLQRTISPQHARNFASAQEAEVVRYLKKLLNNPDGFDEHNKWQVIPQILCSTSVSP